MKKYLLFVFLLISALFSFNFLPQAQAQGTENQECSTHAITDTDKCRWDLYCDSNRAGGFMQPSKGLCTKRDQHICTCKDAGNSRDVVCNGTTIQCKDSNTVCQPDDRRPPDYQGFRADNTPFNIDAGSGQWNNDLFFGVTCQEKHATKSDCKCNGTEGTSKDGKNGFTCTGTEGPGKGKKGDAFCESDQACTNVDKSTAYTGDTNNRSGDLWDTDTEMFGIACAKPVATCKCDTSVAPNGFKCTLNGSEKSDTCDSSDMKCVDDEKSVLPGGKGTENNLFDGVDLKGINCSTHNGETDKPDPTQPPPPSPPCLQYASNGTCASFATGIGDLTTDTEGFITKVFAVLLAISGGIALFLIIRAGYTLMTSQGKPDQINQGREQLIAAIVGLLFLIFSFVILEVIGVDILRVPGLSAGSGGTTVPPGVGAGCNAVTGAGCGSGTTCVSLDGGASGICKESSGASCDVNAVTSQCPSGQTCVSDGTGNGRPGHCK